MKDWSGGIKLKEKSQMTPRFGTWAIRRLKLPLTEEKTMEEAGFERDSQELRVEYINAELPILANQMRR